MISLDLFQALQEECGRELLAHLAPVPLAEHDLLPLLERYRGSSSRSGCCRPSVTLALACSEYPRRCKSRRTEREETSKALVHQF